jgi:hypothetical protein
MGWNNPDGMDFIDIYCMYYAVSLCITSSFYSSFATPSNIFSWDTLCPVEGENIAKNSGFKNKNGRF